MTVRGGGPTAPSPWIERHLSLVPRGGRLLDLAAGSGRHSRLALAAGYAVTALDRDIADLAPIPGIAVLEHDLESGAPWPFAQAFDGIIVTNYLWRPVLAMLPDRLAPGGALLYETFARGHERFGRPTNPDFLLASGELLECARGRLRVVAYEELELADPRPAKVQRLVAVRD